MVDNAFASPIVQRPLELGADVVAYSATKLMDGQGRVLAGAVVGREQWINDVYLAYARHTGPNLSPFNAWVVLKSLETLDLRVRRACENAAKVAAFLSKPACRACSIPALPATRSMTLAMRQMALGGTIIALFLDGGRPQAHALLDALELIDISNNLGDSRSLMTHPASTTHASVSAEVREQMGITEGMLRLSVGLEDADDLIDDLDAGLATGGAMTMAIMPDVSLCGDDARHHHPRGAALSPRTIRSARRRAMSGAITSASRTTRCTPCSCWPATGRSATAMARIDVVDGEGVIGQQPVIEPGQAFDYMSGCPLLTPSGRMVGHYLMDRRRRALRSGASRPFALEMPAPGAPR